MALPAPTALTPTQRYISAGTRRFSFVPTIAVKGAPTSAELTAGTDLTAEIPTDGVAGFSTTSNTVDAGDFGSRFTSKVPGMIEAADSSLKLYLSKNATDARTLLTRDLTGFIVVYPEGIVASGKMSVFPVTITSASVEEGGAGDVATLMVGFAITSTPVENIAIPTS